jgi:hypothetical protein
VGSLYNKHFFLIVLEARKSVIEVPEDLVSGEDGFPGLWLASSFSLYVVESRDSRRYEAHSCAPS